MSVIVPFTGNPFLLKLKASTYKTRGNPSAAIRDNALVFSIGSHHLTAEQVHRQIAAIQSALTERLAWANHDVSSWEPKLRRSIAEVVFHRKETLDHAANLTDALDIPLAVAPPSSQVQIPIQRKTIRVEQGPPAPGNDSPRLADDIYQDVIRTISGMSRAVERLPQTARHLGEDGFRDLLLFMLNANYEGAARGEVFNCKGKTDILLAWKDRNAFIGECKMWHGQKKLSEALDQLLSYAGWRDTKAALILFIRGGSPSEIIKKADAAIREHSSFRTAAPSKDPELRRNYLLTSPRDPQRHISMAFLPVILPEDS